MARQAQTFMGDMIQGTIWGTPQQVPQMCLVVKITGVAMGTRQQVRLIFMVVGITEPMTVQQ